MAKRRKGSTALFEVIHAAKLDGKSPKPAMAALRTPKWWFKGLGVRDKAAAAHHASDPDDPTANVTAASLTQRGRAAPAPRADPAPSPQPPGEPALRSAPTHVDAPSTPPAPPADEVAADEEAADDPTANVAPAPAPPAHDADASTEVDPPSPRPTPAAAAPPPDADDPAAPSAAASAIVPAAVAAAAVAPSAVVPAGSGAMRAVTARLAFLRSARSGVRFHHDPDRQEIALHLRYGTAAVVGFAVLMLIVLAYAVGRRSGRGPAALAAAPAAAPLTTEQVRERPPQIAALEVGRSNRTLSGQSDPSPRSAAPRGAGGDYADAYVEADGRANRTADLNYLLIQTYPPGQRDKAQALCDFLTANNIPCTVEAGNPSQNKTLEGYWAVIGVRGFRKRFGDMPEYNQYDSDLNAAVARYPGQGRADRIQPMTFKWSD